MARAGGDRPGLLSDAGARRRADWREGREPLVELPRRAAAAQGAAVHRPRRARAGVGGIAARSCRQPSRSSTRCRSPRWRASRWRRSKRRPSPKSRARSRARRERRRVDARPASAPRPARLRERQRHQHRAPARLLRDRHRAGLPRRRCSREWRGHARPRSRTSRAAGSRSATSDRSAGSSLSEHAVMTIAVARGLSPVRTVLDNGAVVIVQETSITPAVTINATVRAGSLYEPADRPGLAYLIGRVIDRGTSTRTADVIAEELDDRGVSLRVASTRHATIVTLHLPVRGLRRRAGDHRWTSCAMPMFPEQRDRQAPGRVRSRRSARTKTTRRSARSRALFEMLYGASHPYGRRAKGTVDERRADHSRRPRCASTPRGSCPPLCRWRSSATSRRRMR